MSKSTKTTEVPEEVLPVEPEITVPEAIVEQPEETTEVPEEVVEVAALPIFVPDIPAQIIEVDEYTDEIVFLRRVLDIQREGGFGRHLDVLINDRIKSLKSV